MPKFKVKIEKVEDKKEKKEKQLSKEELEEKHRQVREARALLSWKSASRPFRRRTRRYFVTIGAIVLLLILISTLAQEFLLVGVILAVTFVAYVLATVVPEEIEHKITPYGLVSAGHAYIWGELKSFWFIEKNGHEILEIETTLRFPGRLFLLLGSVSKTGVRDLLSKHMAFREIAEVSFLDRMAQFLAKKIPLED